MVYGRVCLPLHLVDVRRIELLFLLGCVLGFFSRRNGFPWQWLPGRRHWRIVVVSIVIGDAWCLCRFLYLMPCVCER